MPLTFTRIQDQNGNSKEEQCAATLAQKLAGLLNADGKESKKVLWLICGGSNIKISVMTMDVLLGLVSPDELTRMTVTLTDERYGPVGHKDSNWQQLIETGFPFEKVRAVPLLVGLPLAETTKKYGEEISKLFSWADHIVAQFGIGTDGHIGGVLPHTIGVKSQEVTVGYDSQLFIRLSISLMTMQKIKTAFAFVFGESKRDALQKLHDGTDLDELPCRVLKLIPEAYLYTDQNL